jgi:hypothetical protein
MAEQPVHHLAEAAGARERRVKQSNELALGRQTTHSCIRPMLGNQLAERVPGNPLKQIMKHGILMSHGIAPLLSPNVANVETSLESMSCASYSGNEPDSREYPPGMTA